VSRESESSRCSCTLYLLLVVVKRVLGADGIEPAQFLWIRISYLQLVLLAANANSMPRGYGQSARQIISIALGIGGCIPLFGA
jgi:hypothetical protein